MMGEARAVAYGDPTYLGYLSSNVFNRGFPQYVRPFNAAFLALPALEGVIDTNLSSDSEVIVRKITTPSSGTYLAVVNVSFEDKIDVEITMPHSGTVTDAATGGSLTPSGGKLTMSLYPAQLRAIRIVE